MRAFFWKVATTFAMGSAAVLSSSIAAAGGLEFAPPAFVRGTSQAVPMDIEKIDLSLTFDAAAKKTMGVATVIFHTAEEGQPFFDLVPAITSAKVDGVELALADVPVVAIPTSDTKVRVINRVIPAGNDHELQISYDLSEAITFANGVVTAGFFMDDLASGGRKFWELYGPANYEFDQFKQVLHLKITNSDKEHRLFTNAAVSNVAANEWLLDFPDYFTTSSFYLHLVAKNRFVERSGIFHGLEGDIPVLAYAATASNADAGLRDMLKVLAENEQTFGAYAHAQALAYVTPTGGGMEHCGATMTSLWALEHEFTHSWFARGVMPANGNAGWIDEAIASWRDDGYIRASTGPSGAPHNLGGFSPYRRHTTDAAYTTGRDLIGAFDKQFETFSHEGQMGMRGILRMLFQERKRTTISVDFFKSFIERVTGTDLTSTFNKYVFGQGAAVDEKAKAPKSSHHPRPYTKAELTLYR